MTVLYTRIKKKDSAAISAKLVKNRSQKTTLRDKLFGALILTVITLLFMWLTFLIGQSLLPITTDTENMRRFVAKSGIMGRLAFLGIQILLGFLPIPIELTTIAGGYAFGPLQGILLTILAIIISTTIIFYVTKLCGNKLMNLFFTSMQQKKVFFFRDKKVCQTITWIVYLIPGMPKRLFTFSAGLVMQRFRNFLFISVFARMPTIIACTFCGHALERQEYKLALAIFLIIVFLCLIGFYTYQYCMKQKHKNTKI